MTDPGARRLLEAETGRRLGAKEMKTREEARIIMGDCGVVFPRIAIGIQVLAEVKEAHPGMEEETNLGTTEEVKDPGTVAEVKEAHPGMEETTPGTTEGDKDY